MGARMIRAVRQCSQLMGATCFAQCNKVMVCFPLAMGEYCIFDMPS